MSFLLRQPSSGRVVEGENNGDSIFWNATTREWETGPPGSGAVASVFGRTGNVVAQTGDYDSDQIDNVSSIPGATVSDALESLGSSDIANEALPGIPGATVTQALQFLEAAFRMTAGWKTDAPPYVFADPTLLSEGAITGGNCQIFSGGLFSLPDGTQMRLVYNGDPCICMIQVTITVNGISSPNPMVWGVGMSKNGDLTGQAVTSATARAAGVMPLNVLQDDDAHIIQSMRATSLATNDVLELVFGTGEADPREAEGVNVMIWTYPFL